MFFDIEDACLKEIANYAQKLNLASKTTCRNQDSVDGLISMVEELGAQDFLHVDPYFIHKKKYNKNYYYDGFCLVMIKGIIGMLWYGFNTLKEREVLQDSFRAQTDNNSQKKLASN